MSTIQGTGQLDDAISSTPAPTPITGGDMMRSVYDINSNDVVDNSERLGGELPSYYATSAEVDAHEARTDNPHGVTKAQVGLSDVNNTSDANKPVSVAQAAAIAVVQADIDAHEARTDNPHGVTKAQVGLSDVDNTSDANKPVSVAQAAAIAVVQADIDTHEARTDNPHNVTKQQIGLGNADNTSDADKPISNATQSALNNKVDKVAGKGLSTEDYSTLEKSKLAGIQSGATSNSADSTLLSRSNHTGSQTSSTISDFTSAVIAAAPGETASSVGALVDSLASKATPVDADQVGIMDSASSNIWKKLSWLNVKAALKTYFDSLYLALSGGTMTGTLNRAKGNDIVSATTTNIAAATGNYIHITGTTTITAFGVSAAGSERTVVFDSALVLTHSASIILPGSASIATTAGDTATFVSEGSGVWRCVFYQRADDSYINYSCAPSGFSTPPTIPVGAARFKYITRNSIHVIVSPSGPGISNSTTKTFEIPVNASSTSIQHHACPGLNNGAAATLNARTRVGSNTVDVLVGLSTAPTASGNFTFAVNAIFHVD